MRPICVNCRAFYHPKKNGFVFCEMVPTVGPKLGWRAYKVWAGDLWECKQCGHQLIEGVGKEPISEWFEPDFADAMSRVEASVYSK